MQSKDLRAGFASLLFVFLLGVAHAGAYALLTPLWQAPDEPGHFEAACLLGLLARPLRADDLSIPLQQSIIASLAANDFWRQVREPSPMPLPASFSGDPFLARSGRQVGDEPPLYYLFPALLCRSALPLEGQVRLMRLYGAVLFGLTGAVAGWGLDRWRPWPLRRVPPVMMLLPMPAFIAGSINNDGLAMLTATAVFVAVMHVQRLGWSWRRGLGVLASLALALASKKTNNFLLLWVTLLGIYAGWHWMRARSQPMRARRVFQVAGMVAAAGLAAMLLLPSGAPAGWRGRWQPLGGGRVPAPWTAPDGVSGRWAARVVDNTERDYGRLFQNVTGQRAESLRGGTVHASALVRSMDGASQPGRLTVRDAAGYTQAPFEAGQQWQRVELSHTVALTTTYVKLSVAPGAGLLPSETGRLLVADVRLRREAPQGGDVISATDMGDASANILRNGDFHRAARWVERLVAPLENRWEQFAPRLHARDAWNQPALGRYALYAALIFPGFWGNFGWLQRPLPIGLYGVLALVCIAAAAGLARGWRRLPVAVRRLALAWALAVALIALQTLLPMLGRAWQPQGRYLFPALLPITGLLMLGLDAWLDFERHRGRALGFGALLTALAIFCLVQVL